MWIVNFGTMILDRPGGYMIGYKFRNMKLKRKLGDICFYHSNLLGTQPIQYDLGFIHLLKEKETVYLEEKPIGILSNQAVVWPWKGHSVFSKEDGGFY